MRKAHLGERSVLSFPGGIFSTSEVCLMIRSLKLSVIAVAACLALAVSTIPDGGNSPAQAATPNYSLAVTGVQVVPIQISGQYTANTTSVVRFKLPFAAQLIGVSASARASGGTTPTLTVDVKSAGTTVLAAPVAVTAGTVSEANIANAALADEADITFDLAITGTTPTWNDITVVLTIVRK